MDYKSSIRNSPAQCVFYGRAAELQVLSHWLDPSSTTSPYQGPRTLLLSGMGGIGKTQLALEYAYNRLDQYAAVFWLRSETMRDLTESCLGIVQSLGLVGVQPGTEILAFKTWLAETDLPCLLIMDNVEQDDLLLEIWPSKLLRGSIIATSRRTDLRAFDFDCNLELLPFEMEDGAKLLRSLLQETGDTSYEASLCLSQILGGHPLAIAQIAGAIRRRHMSIAEFLPTYEKIDRRRPKLPSYSYDLDSLWLLSFKTLSKESYRLLGIISYLHPDSIPDTLLCQDDSKIFKLNDAARELNRTSLIRRHSGQSGTNIFSVHRLVQRTFRDHLSPQERLSAFDDATWLLFNAIKSEALSDTTQCEDIYEFLRPHIANLKDFQEARNSETFAALLSYVTNSEVSLLNEHFSVSSEDTAQDHAFSDFESVSSQSTVFADETRSATSLLVELFSNDAVLVKSARALLSNVDEDRFRHDFADLLKLFSKDLSLNSTLDTQLQTFDWIDSRRRLISQEFLAVLKPSSKSSLTQLPQEQGNDHLILERYLESLDLAIEDPAHPTALENSNLDTAVHYPDNLSPEFLDGRLGSNAKANDGRGFESRIQHLVTLISHSSSFEKLKRNLDWIGKPHICGVEGCDRSEGFSTASELKQHKILKHKTAAGTSTTSDFVDHLCMVLVSIKTWIALGSSLYTNAIAGIYSRKEPRPANMVQGRWTCACGEVIIDDFHESAPGHVASAMSELGANQNSQASSTNAPSLASALNLFSSLGDRMELLTAFVSTILANFRGNLTRSGKNRNQGSRAVEEMDELPIANALPPRYLLLCISMWKGYYFTQMLPVDLNVANDEMLFCQLKSAYHCQVGLWKRILSLRCIKDIRFVRFHTTRSRLVDINLHSRMESRIRETLPPADHGDYSYSPKPILVEPPVGHNTMMHLYRCPKSSRSLIFCLKRFPGYCQQQLRMAEGADEELAWGVELVEGRDWVYLYVIGFLISSFGMAFGIAWSVARNDISGGFTVAGAVVTTFTCLVGTIQVALEAL